MKPEAIKTFVLLAIIIATILLISKNTLSVDTSRHQAVLQNINDVQELDMGLNESVLRLRYNLLDNYDPVIKLLDSLREKRAALWSGNNSIPYPNSPEIKSAFDQFDKTLAEKTAQIEDFKSRNAVLKNSLQYFPKIMAQALKELPRNAKYDDVSRVLQDLSIQVTSLPMRSIDKHSAMDVDASILLLHKSISGEPKSFQDLVGLLIRHAEIIIEFGSEVDDLVQRILRINQLHIGAEIQTAYEHESKIAEDQSNISRVVLFVLSLILGIYVVVSYFKLSNQSLLLRSAMRELENFKHAIDEHSIVSIADVRGDITYVNDKFCQISGYERNELVGQNHRIVKSDEHSHSYFKEMWRDIASGHVWHGELKNRKKDGGEYWVSATIVPFMNSSNKPEKYISIRTDITQLKQSKIEIDRLAYFDSLTDLPNRRLMLDRLDQEIKKATRSKEQLAILFIDLDRFKEVNDSLGHHIGDDLLIEASNRLKCTIRETDTVARLGGDEFVVILTQIKGASDIEQVAQNIIKTLSNPYSLGSELIFSSASIGVAVYPEDSMSPVHLLQYADQAMYDAKEQGRNRLSFFTPAMQIEAQGRLRLITELGSALKENQFRVYFQPIVELNSNRIFKAEALLRWQHPERGLVSPMAFIPLAEETGLIIDIGNWLFHESARWVAQWKALSSSGFQISINKSPIQFRNKEGNEGTSWPSYLKELGLSGSNIAIEITEGMLLNNDESTRSKLHQFRDAGIQISIDDFGTGYSALSYLKKFDIDYLKIDMSFVRNIVSDPADQALCEAIIVMAHKLGFKVIAEGVETIEQRNLLIDIGCDFGQGYLFSKPVQGEELDALLRSRST